MKSFSVWRRAVAMTAVAVLPWAAIAADAPKSSVGMKSAAGNKQIERGRYLVSLGGCNDCHTAGYAPREGKVPESEWLLGSGPLGYSGPWGTTYAPNLRLTLSKMSEAEWVKYARTLKTRPPMPWFNVNKMSEPDLRAMYRYIRSLTPVGAAAHAYLPPEQQPTMPFVQWPMPSKQ